MNVKCIKNNIKNKYRKGANNVQVQFQKSWGYTLKTKKECNDLQIS